MRILCSSDVDAITVQFSPAFLSELMADTFTDPTGQCPERSSVKMDNFTSLFMPAALRNVAAFKVVSIAQRGLSASTCVLDETTGAIKALVNARRLTALRNAGGRSLRIVYTAAHSHSQGSLLSTKLLYAADPRHIVLFGAGDQIRCHAQVFLRAYSSIKKCSIINRTRNERLLNLERDLNQEFPSVDIVVNEDVQATLSLTSIVICATPSSQALFPSHWIPGGTHVVLIGSYSPSMKEVEPSLLQRARPSVVVDSRRACIQEAGEIIEAGLNGEDLTEIGELVTKARQGEQTRPDLREQDITLFKSVGLGIQDVAIASAVVRAGEDLGLGIIVET